MKKIIIAICFVLFLINYSYFDTNSITKVDGCNDLKTQFKVIDHEGIYSDIYEIVSNNQKFLLLVSNVPHDNRIDKPTIEFTECNYNSKIKVKEQIGQNERVDLE